MQQVLVSDNCGYYTQFEGGVLEGRREVLLLPPGP